MSYKLNNLNYLEAREILKGFKENDKYYCFTCNSHFSKPLYLKSDNDKELNLCPNCYENDDYDCKFDFEIVSLSRKMMYNTAYGNFVDYKPEIKKKKEISNKNVIRILRLIFLIASIMYFGLPLIIYLGYYLGKKYQLKKQKKELRNKYVFR